MFLSGSSSQTSQSFNGESSITKSRDSSNSNGSECVIDIEERVRTNNKTSGTRRTWSSPNFSSLRIIVPGDKEEEEEEEEDDKLVAQIEATPKVKGTKPMFLMQRLPDRNQLFDTTGCFQNLIRLSFAHPIKLNVCLMQRLFLLLLFVVYSS